MGENGSAKKANAAINEMERRSREVLAQYPQIANAAPDAPITERVEATIAKMKEWLHETMGKNSNQLQTYFKADEGRDIPGKKLELQRILHGDNTFNTGGADRKTDWSFSTSSHELYKILVDAACLYNGTTAKQINLGDYKNNEHRFGNSTPGDNNHTGRYPV